MGRPYRPDQGVNRQLLEALRRDPVQWPGRLARLIGSDTTMVLSALRRMEAHGLVTIGPPDDTGRRPVAPTAAGLAVLGKGRKARRRRATV